MVLFVVFAVEAEGAIDHGPCLREHHLEGGRRLREGDGRRRKQVGLKILEMDFLRFDGDELLADFHENGDERDEEDGRDEIENRVGVGDETASGGAFGALADEMEEDRFAADVEPEGRDDEQDAESRREKVDERGLFGDAV